MQSCALLARSRPERPESCPRSRKNSSSILPAEKGGSFHTQDLKEYAGLGVHREFGSGDFLVARSDLILQLDPRIGTLIRKEEWIVTDTFGGKYNDEGKL